MAQGLLGAVVLFTWPRLRPYPRPWEGSRRRHRRRRLRGPHPGRAAPPAAAPRRLRLRPRSQHSHPRRPAPTRDTHGPPRPTPSCLLPPLLLPDADMPCLVDGAGGVGRVRGLRVAARTHAWIRACIRVHAAGSVRVQPRGGASRACGRGGLLSPGGQNTARGWLCACACVCMGVRMRACLCVHIEHACNCACATRLRTHAGKCACKARVRVPVCASVRAHTNAADPAQPGPRAPPALLPPGFGPGLCTATLPSSSATTSLQDEDAECTRGG